MIQISIPEPPLGGLELEASERERAAGQMGEDASQQRRRR